MTVLATTIAQVRGLVKQEMGSWGLVPTMGALHQGHLSLVRRARAENDHVVVSIFVNPTQFAPGTDYGKYPRNLINDLSLLGAEGVEVVFAPAVEEMYPEGFQTHVIVEQLTRSLEGAARPGHFQGVATVVTKLFNIIHPDKAYFGQKDAQQVAVIKQLVRDLNLPVEIIVSETIREHDGLAMSSRNEYLSGDERRAAGVLYRALCAARQVWERGEHDGEVLRGAMRRELGLEPLATVEYTSVADPTTLDELIEVKDNILLSLAVRIGNTRLIDNFLLSRSA